MAAVEAVTSASIVVELNVGGVIYATTRATLTKYPDSLLYLMFQKQPMSEQQQQQQGTDASSNGNHDSSSSSNNLQPIPDSKGRYFVDRDGVLFRYVLDFLRTGKLVLPENFHERERLHGEADYFRLTAMVKVIGQLLQSPLGVAVSPSSTLGHHRPLCATTSAPASDDVTSSTADGKDGCEAGYITVGYRGTFAYGREGGSDVKFRKMNRILVCGRVSLCRAAFGDTLNESRDPDRGPANRYTSRFFLRHLSLEHAFDTLQVTGFRLVSACASGTSTSSEYKTGMDSEENKWYHYNEFVFCRP